MGMSARIDGVCMVQQVAFFNSRAAASTTRCEWRCSVVTSGCDVVPCIGPNSALGCSAARDARSSCFFCFCIDARSRCRAMGLGRARRATVMAVVFAYLCHRTCFFDGSFSPMAVKAGCARLDTAPVFWQHPEDAEWMRKYGFGSETLAAFLRLWEVFSDVCGNDLRLVRIGKKDQLPDFRVDHSAHPVDDGGWSVAAQLLCALESGEYVVRMANQDLLAVRLTGAAASSREKVLALGPSLQPLTCKLRPCDRARQREHAASFQ
ncbi:unnamed protein product [Symbiodinium sp. CCMP2592]|nr:unnamed protein product [Symbiodinium sp. CCMP2592]